MEKEVVLWATLRRLRNSGFYAWDEQELAFVQEVVKQDTFAACLPLLSDHLEHYIAVSPDRTSMAQSQYESHKDEVEPWFQMYKPVFVGELERLG